MVPPNRQLEEFIYQLFETLVFVALLFIISILVPDEATHLANTQLTFQVNQ